MPNWIGGSSFNPTFSSVRAAAARSGRGAARGPVRLRERRQCPGRRAGRDHAAQFDWVLTCPSINHENPQVPTAWPREARAMASRIRPRRRPTVATKDWQEYLVLLRTLRWVLTGALLLQTGIESGRLRERLQQHEPYWFLLQQAQQWLPDLYSASTQEPDEDETERARRQATTESSRAESLARSCPGPFCARRMPLRAFGR
jgi:hypothetical protein